MNSLLLTSWNLAKAEKQTLFWPSKYYRFFGPTTQKKNKTPQYTIMEPSQRFHGISKQAGGKMVRNIVYIWSDVRSICYPGLISWSLPWWWNYGFTLIFITPIADKK
jgi:hypothetical protein